MDSSTKNFLEKAIVISLILLGIINIYSFFSNGLDNMANLFNQYDLPSNISSLVRYLFDFITSIFIIIGIVQMIMYRKFELLPIFKFPIILRFVGSIIWLIITLLLPEYNFINFSEGSNAFSITIQLLNLFFLICTLAYYSNQRAPISYTSAKPVEKISRFFDYFIDTIIIYYFILSYMSLIQFSYGISYSGNEATFLIYGVGFGVQFIYYFVSEVLFLQTIGKLHNNSYVAYSGNRFGTILIRTLCRFIPFDPLSFFGQKGWHDSVSKTTVSMIEQTSTDEIEEIGVKEI